ncbi:hypothetical protein PILCRDRAFT_87729 [Piloderma croceum F 1598]|uniref:Uncharacterized protein n=1 Tax=Piloderma croceum (strain F 1598) TaxID=765440 RepID=A0A0C3FXS7_PILCF|nr:hypothetical protein PILCRDRAFT_87729 [Piloderma croceum F 1598]
MPEVEQCLLILQELLDQADATWIGLAFTGIGDLWHHVWWGRWDGNEFALLRKKLSDSRQSLERFLMALHLSHQIKRSACIESLGGHYTGTDNILHHVEGATTPDRESFHIATGLSVVIVLDSSKFQKPARTARSYVPAAAISTQIPLCKCSGQFQIAEANLNHQGKENNTCLGDKERSEMLGEERSNESDEEIISPAFGLRGIVKGNTFASGQPRQLHDYDDDDDVQFLRCIHVICMNDQVIPLGSIEPDQNPGGVAVNLDQLFGRIEKLPTIHSKVRTTTTPDDVLENQLSRNSSDLSSHLPSMASSDMVAEGSVNVTLDDVLNHLPYGAKSGVAVNDLIQAAQEFYGQIEILYEEESISGHPAALAVVKEIKAATIEYSEAITMSVKMAGHGATFAAYTVGLYEHLSRHSGMDVCLFMDEMWQIACLAHVNVKESYEKFSTIRRIFLQIIRQTSQQKEQVTLELLDKVASNLLSPIQIDMARNSWGAVQREYAEYKNSIGTLHDFYPTHKMQISDPWFRRIFRRKATGHPPILAPSQEIMDYLHQQHILRHQADAENLWVVEKGKCTLRQR